MTLSFPTALLWLLLAAPIIALYVLRVRLRRVPISTGMFWKQVYKKNRPYSLWKRLRHLTSLLLQLLFLFLLATAVADPWFSSQEHISRKIALVIDPSASMQATDIAPTRFDAARRSAHEMIDSLGTNDEMAIVVAGPTPRVTTGMTRHQRVLHQAVAAIEPIDAAANLIAAAEMAQHLLNADVHGAVIILTDGCDRSLEDSGPVADFDNVEYRTFASDAANVAITQFQTRRSLVDPLTYEILIQVRNASPASLQCRLELDLNDIPVDVLPLDLAPEEIWERSIEKTTADGGVLTASLQIENGAASNASPETNSPSNCLPVDDIGYSMLAERQRQKILLVTPGNVFLEKVIEASPLAALKVVQTPPEEWPTDAIIVLHQQALQQIPNGNVIVVDPVGSSDLWQIGQRLMDPIVTAQNNASPLMNHVRLDNVVIPTASRISFGVPAELLASCATGDPVYALLKRGKGQCLLLNVNLDSSDLAFRTAFPILINNALGWFGRKHGELSLACRTGEVATVPVIAHQGNGGRQQYRLIHPDGSSSSLVPPRPGDATAAGSTQQVVSVGPLMDTGIYRIEASQHHADTDTNTSSASTLVPVSLLSVTESDLRPQFRREETPTTRADNGRSPRPVWFYLAAVAGILSLAEWGLFNRRYTD